MSVTRFSFEQLTVGAADSLSLEVTEETVTGFGRLVKDLNPVHLDEQFAARSIFGRRVAHGMLAAGLISAVLGTKLPGPGGIYLSQKLDFKKPVFLGDAITARVEIMEKNAHSGRVRLRTWVENQDGHLVLDGQAEVLVR
ncbi:MAG: MaoC family dehydratase [Candidatus Adiutrix sp.]|jgi:3-hydroxybutyryl-CoA dehydratase|nr:MaoC family dehydratase [Candidatus Adiutrix sp.]